MKKVTKNGDRVRVATVNAEPSKTQQQFRDQCDVNLIIAKYKKTGEITHLARQRGIYADVSSITDYRDSLQKVLDAQSAFGTLPSHLRVRFANDPQRLLEFLQDPNNYEEGIQLGLLTPKPTANAPTAKNDETKNDEKPRGAKRAVKEEQLPFTPTE